MKNSIRIIQLLAILALTPVYLAVNQRVPTLSTYQNIMLLCTLGAFGMMIAQFWLTRAKLLGLSKVPTSTVIRYHKFIGIIAGGFLLLHPILMVARRFWVVESDPIDNLKLLIQSLALRPAVAAWIVLALLLLLSASRIHRRMRFQDWRQMHGILSVAFILLASWHVIAVGRHSNVAMSAFWILLCGASVVPLVISWLPAISLKLKRPAEPNNLQPKNLTAYKRGAQL